VRLLAIDPGTTESAYAMLDMSDCRPVTVGKVPNEELLDMLTVASGGRTVIEMVASYGMPVGREVFETCVWIGRFLERVGGAELIYRSAVKLHHCHSAKANDANVTQALIDRFASGERNRGKGTARAPGWFYGFSGDIWQAYALGVYACDMSEASCERNLANARSRLAAAEAAHDEHAGRFVALMRNGRSQ